MVEIEGKGTKEGGPASKNQISIRAGGRPSLQFDGDIEGGSEEKDHFQMETGGEKMQDNKVFDLISPPKES